MSQVYSIISNLVTIQLNKHERKCTLILIYLHRRGTSLNIVGLRNETRSTHSFFLETLTFMLAKMLLFLLSAEFKLLLKRYNNYYVVLCRF